MAPSVQGPPGSGTAILWTVVAESLDPAYRENHVDSHRSSGIRGPGSPSDADRATGGGADPIGQDAETSGGAAQPAAGSDLAGGLSAATAITMVALLVLGVGLGVCVTYLASRGETTRSALKTKVLEQRQLLAERESDVAALDRQVAALADDALGNKSSTSTKPTEHLAAAAAVQGPGLVVLLSDPVGSSNKKQGKSQRIMDSDVQLVVNELWAGGAEAIVVNGQRLSPTTAIREAGDVILVNYSPVQSPYRIAAIGPAAQMRDQINSSSVAKLLNRLVRTTGVSWKTVPVDRVEAPAANVLVGKTRAVAADPQPSP